MFTYSKPDYPATTTRRSIEYRGKREVYHSKQHGTAVGFIGSGMTGGYGRLSYNELVRLLALRVLEELRVHIKSNDRDGARPTRRPLSPEQDREIRELGRSLAAQLDQTDKFDWVVALEGRQTVDIRVDFLQDVDTSTALLEVLTELARAIGNEDLLAREVARLFQSQPLDQFDARLQLVGGAEISRDYLDSEFPQKSIHERWIHAVFLPNLVLDAIIGERGEPEEGKGKIKEVLEAPEISRLVEMFQKSFEKSRRKLHGETAAIDCKDAIIAAYQSAMRSLGVTVPDTIAHDWYDILSRSFTVAGTAETTLYDPAKPKKSSPPDMCQIVLSAWSLLSAIEPGKRDDAYRAIFFSLAHIRNLDDVALKDWPDPIDSTVRSLGLKRLLTVNYDHELERYFRRRFGFSFSDLNVDPGDVQRVPVENEPDEDRQTFYNGSGVRLIRAEMQKTSVSELLDFAIPHDEDMHIYYLHGRAGDPETTKRDDVILAERDYQRHYLENTIVRRGFDESLRALFAANTVIFLGVGMSEADLLRPLREFVSDDQKWRRTSGGPIAIMNGGKDSENESKAAQYNVNFGAKTMFYDTYIDLPGADKKRITRKQLKDLQESVKAILKATKENRNKELEKFKRDEGGALKNALDLMSDCLGLSPMRHNLAEDDTDGWLFLYAMLSRLETYVLSASLDRFLKGITPGHAKWLHEWSRLPDQRMSRFVDWSKQASGELKTTLWIRQRIMHGNPRSNHEPDDCPHFAYVRELLSNKQSRHVEGVVDEQDKKNVGRRVARIWGPRGVGKGALIHALQMPDGFNALFPQKASQKKNPYAGAFFADARYSTEFNSVITALARFVAGRTVQINRKTEQTDEEIEEAISKAEIDALGDGTQARVDDLDQCFDRIVEELEEFKKNANGRRLLLCLSGIERLFRYEGQAYQAIHGAFFRLLLGEALAGIPIDVIFVVGAESQQNAENILDLRRQLATKNEEQDNSDARNASGTDTQSPASVSAVANGRGTGVSPQEDSVFATASKWVELKQVPLVGSARVNNPQRKWIVKNLGERSRAIKFFRDNFAQAVLEKDRQGSGKAENFRKIQTLYRVLSKNTCLVMWLLHLLDEILPVTAGGNARVKNGKPVALWDDLGCTKKDADFLSRFEVAAHGGEAAVIEEIMRCYSALDEPRQKGEAVDERPSKATIRDEIIRHLAFFSVPVERAVLASCPEIASLHADDLRGAGAERDLRRPPTERETAVWLKDHLEALYERRLIIRLHAARPRGVKQTNSDEQDPHIRYFLHSRMREHISRQMNFDLFEVGEHSFFNLSLYGAQPKDMPSPRTHDYRFIGEILHRLIYQSRTDVHPFFVRQTPLEGMTLDDHEKERKPWRRAKLQEMDTPLSPTRRIRAAQSLLAGSFSIGVITRFDNLRGLPERMWEQQTPFDNYCNWLRSLANIANAIDVTEENYVGAVQEVYRGPSSDGLDRTFDWSNCERVTRPFYANEIAWLYNERALGRLVQGKIGESLALFDQAGTLLRTLRWTEDDANGPTGSSLRILALNRAVALIEAGHAEEAARILRPIDRYENTGAPKPRLLLTPYLAKGYLGLINHLQGRLKSAQDQYKEAINGLYEAEAPRGAAIFQKHLGDLYRGLRLFEQADEEIRRAIAEAKSTRQMDIFHQARISLARVEFARDNTLSIPNRRRLEEAMVYGERLGIPKIVVEVDTLMAAYHINNHELDTAGERLVRAIALSSRHSMNLRKIAAVQAYLNLAEARSDAKLVKRMRRKLSDLTEKFEYQLPSYRVLTGSINSNINYFQSHD